MDLTELNILLIDSFVKSNTSFTVVEGQERTQNLASHLPSYATSLLQWKDFNWFVLCHRKADTDSRDASYCKILFIVNPSSVVILMSLHQDSKGFPKCGSTFQLYFCPQKVLWIQYLCLGKTWRLKCNFNPELQMIVLCVTVDRRLLLLLFMESYSRVSTTESNFVFTKMQAPLRMHYSSRTFTRKEMKICENISTPWYALSDGKLAKFT